LEEAWEREGGEGQDRCSRDVEFEVLDTVDLKIIQEVKERGFLTHHYSTSFSHISSFFDGIY